jgi:hypothetical protein
MLCPQTRGAARGNGDTMGMRGEILHAHPEPKHDVEVLHRRVAQRRLEVAAVNDPIRRAITLRRSCAKRNPHDLTAAAPAKHAYGRGRHYVPLQTIGEPEAD